MLRVALGAVLVSAAAAGLGNECMKGLQLLEGESDVELAARCRAAFAPEVCRQARQSLGAQPWTSTRLKESCARFASAFDEGMDERALEAAVSKKAAYMPAPPAKMDASTQGKPRAAAAPKPAAPEKQPQPMGPVANLLNKLKEAKEAKEAADGGKKAKDEGQRPLAHLLGGLKKKREEAEARQMKKEDTEAKAKGEKKPSGHVANVRKMMDEEEPSDPLDTMLKKITEAKEAREFAEANGQDTPNGLKELLTNIKKLYGEAELGQPAASNRLPQVLGALAGAASMAALTLLVAARRARRTSGLHEELNVQQDAEQIVE